MGRYEYTDSEKETLKVLSMQEKDLKNLEKSETEDRQKLAALRKRLEALGNQIGVDLSKVKSDDTPKPFKVSRNDIPSWDSLAQRANKEIPYDVELEDLLTQEEFQFCIDEVERINDEFSKRTSIVNKVDLSFLAVATALQTLRWVIIQEVCGDLGQKIDANSRLNHNDPSIKKEVNEMNKDFQSKFSSHGHAESSRGYKSWEQIVFDSAPFDANVNSGKFGVNLGGMYHRVKTLGHDPILGWLFGTANFITDTITLTDFSSYRVTRKPSLRFDSPVATPMIFAEAFDSIKEDWLRLPAAIFAEYVHLKSDMNTKLGLPIPLLSSFSESLAGDLYKSQYDSLCLAKDLAIVGKQAGFSILINMIIGLIHGLFYNPQKDGDRRLYEVRTRKILLISNSLASAGNIVYSIISEDWRKLDIGGIFVTITRLFTDTRFMARIKEEFIQKEMDKVLEKEIKQIDSYFY